MRDVGRLPRWCPGREEAGVRQGVMPLASTSRAVSASAHRHSPRARVEVHGRTRRVRRSQGWNAVRGTRPGLREMAEQQETSERAWTQSCSRAILKRTEIADRREPPGRPVRGPHPHRIRGIDAWARLHDDFAPVVPGEVVGLRPYVRSATRMAGLPRRRARGCGDRRIHDTPRVSAEHVSPQTTRGTQARRLGCRRRGRSTPGDAE